MVSVMLAVVSGALWMSLPFEERDSHEVSEDPSDRELPGDDSIGLEEPPPLASDHRDPAEPATGRPDVAVATDPNRRYNERFAAARRLPADLADDEIAVLLDYLNDASAFTAGSPMRERGLRNEIMNLLRSREPAVPGLAEVLAGIFADTGADPVVRDYALQHLGAWYPRAPQEERWLILETLADAVAETDSSIAGTALLALRDIRSAADEAVASDTLAGLAREIATDATNGDSARITALQVAAESGSTEILQTAASLALDQNEPYPLRLSAIASLRKLGGDEADEILGKVESLQDPYLAAAFGGEMPEPEPGHGYLP